MNVITVCILIGSAVLLNAIPTQTPDGIILDVNSPEVQQMARAAVANYSLGITKDCLKYAYTLKSVEKAIALNNFCACTRIELTKIYNSNCPFESAKTCKKQPNHNDVTSPFVVEVTGPAKNIWSFKIISSPPDVPDC